MEKAVVVTIVIIGLGLLAFMFIDESLEDETKAWLDVSPTDNSDALVLLERFNRIAEAYHQGRRSGPSYLEVEKCATVAALNVS